MVTTINPSDQTITQYNVQTGGANNLLNNVTPSATSGVPLISQGASSQPIFGTAAIAGGGTNATSFTQSQGVVVYNGTSLVNYTGPQISSGGVNTNTTQPAFLAYVATAITNVTGDGTVYKIIYDTKVYDQGSNFVLATSIFTAPVTGKYLINYVVRVQNGSTITVAVAQVVTTSTSYRMSLSQIIATLSGTGAQGTMAVIAAMTAGDTMIVNVTTTDGSGKVDGISGTSSGSLNNILSCELLC